MIATMVKAPKKLSDAVIMALKDLVKVEKSKKYEIDMGTWFYPNDDLPCEVCFAGCVMAMTHKDAVAKSLRNVCELIPEQFGGGWDSVFEALNSIREFNVWSALHEMGTLPTKWMEHSAVSLSWRMKRDIGFDYSPAYCKDPKLFKQAMRKIVKWLQSHGL